MHGRIRLAFLKYMDRLVLVSLKCMEGFIFAQVDRWLCLSYHLMLSRSLFHEGVQRTNRPTDGPTTRLLELLGAAKKKLCIQKTTQLLKFCRFRTDTKKNKKKIKNTSRRRKQKKMKTRITKKIEKIDKKKLRKTILKLRKT